MEPPRSRGAGRRGPPRRALRCLFRGWSTVITGDYAIKLFPPHPGIFQGEQATDEVFEGGDRVDPLAVVQVGVLPALQERRQPEVRVQPAQPVQRLQVL